MNLQLNSLEKGPKGSVVLAAADSVPLDTWVDQIAIQLHFAGKNRQARRDRILAFCTDNQIPPIALNEGFWYIGANSFVMLLDILSGP